MKHSSILLFLLNVILLSSCQSKETKSNPINYEKTLSNCKQIILPVDENTDFLSKSIFQFEENGKEFLYFENSQNSTYDIVIFDLDSQKVERRIPIHPEGPNGVPSLFGSKPYPDSNTILAFQHFAFRISLLNGKGEVLRNYQLNPKERFVRVILSTFSYMPTFTRDSVLYFAQRVCDQKRSVKDFTKIPLFASMDLKTGEIGWPSLYFPATFDGDYTDIHDGDVDFAHDYNEKDNRLVCSFMKYDSIMVTDDLQHVKWYNAKSKYLKSMKPNVNNHTNDVNALIRYKESSKYGHIMYDKYRDVYYRFAEMPCELAKDETPYDNQAPKAREFSVIILNDKFEIIGETKFPGSKYFYKMSFVGKDGLYISENNLANPEFDEDKLVFSCFKLVDINE